MVLITQMGQADLGFAEGFRRQVQKPHRFCRVFQVLFQ